MKNSKKSSALPPDSYRDAPHPALYSVALAKEHFDRPSFSEGDFITYAKIINNSDYARRQKAQT
jgi:hypothetical protein